MVDDEPRLGLGAAMKLLSRRGDVPRLVDRLVIPIVVYIPE
jgi:hypothetical protein